MLHSSQQTLAVRLLNRKIRLEKCTPRRVQWVSDAEPRTVHGRPAGIINKSVAQRCHDICRFAL
eukprot:1850325-Amphidinium_carterae.2